MKGRRTPFMMLGAAMLLGACGDATTAPQAESRAASNLTLTLSKENSGVGTFTIPTNKRITVVMGSHRLTVPAGAVCDPLTSGYGEAMWDAPCASSATPIVVTVNWNVSNGMARLSFSPDLRFVPTASTNANDWVVLQLKNATSLLAESNYQIYWRNAAGSWVDESLTDASLRSWTNRSENKVSRRLKHFSGYVIGTSFREEVSGMDPDAGTEVIAY